MKKLRLRKLKIRPKLWGKYVPDSEQTHKSINSKAIISFSCDKGRLVVFVSNLVIFLRVNNNNVHMC